MVDSHRHSGKFQKPQRFYVEAKYYGKDVVLHDGFGMHYVYDKDENEHSAVYTNDYIKPTEIAVERIEQKEKFNEFVLKRI